jgi:hypothetical protein
VRDLKHYRDRTKDKLLVEDKKYRMIVGKSIKKGLIIYFVLLVYVCKYENIIRVEW